MSFSLFHFDWKLKWSTVTGHLAVLTSSLLFQLCRCCRPLVNAAMNVLLRTDDITSVDNAPSMYMANPCVCDHVTAKWCHLPATTSPVYACQTTSGFCQNKKASEASLLLTRCMPLVLPSSGPTDSTMKDDWQPAETLIQAANENPANKCTLVTVRVGYRSRNLVVPRTTRIPTSDIQVTTI